VWSVGATSEESALLRSKEAEAEAEAETEGLTASDAARRAAHLIEGLGVSVQGLGFRVKV